MNGRAAWFRARCSTLLKASTSSCTLTANAPIPACCPSCISTTCILTGRSHWRSLPFTAAAWRWWRRTISRLWRSSAWDDETHLRRRQRRCREDHGRLRAGAAPGGEKSTPIGHADLHRSGALAGGHVANQGKNGATAGDGSERKALSLADREPA